ncbi:alpha/beta fold hydrolase [Variovorax paradoxus]|jgi:pimeloyl-ACP methyl ester carboxylesterase|uniref:alpha/beta fold hydrolase n=1 Tax=Variovorax paradoxus TaxID=34073 RepID=UPI003390EEC4
MARFILVPGGWHGAWAFDAVSNALSSEGHEVQALTLSGLGDEPANGTNLERHINEVVQAVRGRDTRAVLVGHSYGGRIV